MVSSTQKYCSIDIEMFGGKHLEVHWLSQINLENSAHFIVTGLRHNL